MHPKPGQFVQVVYLNDLTQFGQVLYLTHLGRVPRCVPILICYCPLSAAVDVVTRVKKSCQLLVIIV